MQECWAAEPAKRPLLGTVEPRLQSLFEIYTEKCNIERSQERKARHNRNQEVTDLFVEKSNLDDQTVVSSHPVDEDKIDSAVDAVTEDNDGFVGWFMRLLFVVILNGYF